jgi:UDP-N-acetylmuramoyl-L-alanyl-D-glutamate--2,6-diaminopimelate ligase
MRLSRLVAEAGLAQDAAVAGLGADPEITNLTCDSREARDGSVFFALSGHRAHGASFAQEAVRSGASVIVTDEPGARLFAETRSPESLTGVPVLVLSTPRASMAALASAFHGFPARSMTMVGVTGTNGKTTVTYLVQAALQAANLPCGIVGTLGTYFESWGTRAHPRTTPEATDLQRILADLRRDGAVAVAMEVSSIAVREQRVDGIEFDVMGFTGLSHDHLDYHGTMDAYFEAKAEMFTSGRCKAGVVVVDQPWGQRLATRSVIPITTVSTRPDIDATWRAQRTGDGIRIEGPQTAFLNLPVATEFAIANTTLAIAIAHSLGVPAQLAADALAVASVPGRMEVVASVDGCDFIVDYAHTPDAIDRVVSAAVDSHRNRRSGSDVVGRVLVVIGAGGDRDPGKRSAMGRAASQADVVIVTDDNPRTEDPAQIRSTVRHGAEAGRANVLEIAPREEAIARVVAEARPGDVVLVLGKGHEATQEIDGRVVAFDDREVLASFVRQRFGSGGGGRGDGA